MDLDEIEEYVPSFAQPEAVAAAPEVVQVEEKMEKLAVEAKPAVAVEVDPAAEAEFSDNDDQEELEEIPRRHLNILFIGHVDAGKSTISGHIMYLSGKVDERTMDKFEKDAKAQNRESWKYAWAMDTTDQERAKGKTEEVGRAGFATEHRAYTILDAPGHKNYVPHMIGGASQADVGILVISARKGEFEAGFEKGGQTREHAMLAKTAGVKRLIVVINKMDECSWAKERYTECVTKLKPYLKQVGYNTKEVIFLPLSGLQGINLKTRIPEGLCPFYSGPSLLEILDQLEMPARLYDSPVRMPVVEKYSDMGSSIVMGKLESGVIKRGDNLLLMPNRVPVEVMAVFIEDYKVKSALPGDNCRLRLRGVSDDQVHPGFVVSSVEHPCEPQSLVEAQFVIMETKSIICAGYGCVMHIHSAVVEVNLKQLLACMDRATKKGMRNPKFVKQGMTVNAVMELDQAICVAPFDEYQQLGRFVLRDEGRTIAVGKITKCMGTN
jgi:peptide chain release factor subunit 3